MAEALNRILYAVFMSSLQQASAESDPYHQFR